MEVNEIYDLFLQISKEADDDISGNKPKFNILFKQYNILITELKTRYSSDKYIQEIEYITIPESFSSTGEYGIAIDKMLTYSSLILTYLKDKISDPYKIADKLKSELKETKIKLLNEAKETRELLKILYSIRTAKAYPVDENTLLKFKGKNFKFMLESLKAYEAAAYTACVCVCRNVFQDLIQKLCKKYQVKEEKFKKKIEILTNKIKGDSHKALINITKVFGDFSAHQSEMDIDKANIILGSIFTLIKDEELFN